MTATRWSDDQEPLTPAPPPREPLTPMLAAAALVLSILALLTAFFGVVMAGAAASAFVAGVPGPTGIFVGLGGAVLVIGMLGVAASIGLLAGRRWAPALALVVSALEGVGGLAALVLAIVQPDPGAGTSAGALLGPVALIGASVFVGWAVVRARRAAPSAANPGSP